MNRRQLITGLVTLVAAPAIVRVANIMPIRVMPPVGYIGGSLHAEDCARFYARLKLYFAETDPWDRLNTLYLFGSPSPLTNWRTYEAGRTDT